VFVIILCWTVFINLKWRFISYILAIRWRQQAAVKLWLISILLCAINPNESRLQTDICLSMFVAIQWRTFSELCSHIIGAAKDYILRWDLPQAGPYSNPIPIDIFILKCDIFALNIYIMWVVITQPVKV
jgi:hypothetical protein